MSRFLHSGRHSALQSSGTRAKTARRTQSAPRAPARLAEWLESRTLLSASYALNTIGLLVTSPTGAYPQGTPVVDALGNLYGTASGGGASNEGTVFERFQGSGILTALASFSGANGAHPDGGVVFDAGGNLYGTASGGGDAGDHGTIFEITRGSGVITPLALFNGANGADPTGGVVLDASGNLYGTTAGGGPAGDGTVFEVVKGSGTITTLTSFNGSNGANPIGGVVFDAGGNLYGTTSGGGDANGDGTVFEIAKGSGVITTLASFDGTDASDPDGRLVLDGNGNLYGTTLYGGATGWGTVFEIAKGSGTITNLAMFDGANGAQPSGDLAMDANGNLYGTTHYGGVNLVNGGDGTVFEIVKGSGVVTTLASFQGSDGAYPAGAVLLDASGNVYGTTLLGGPSGEGALFEIVNGSGRATPIAFFYSDYLGPPNSSVVLDASGDLYGTTYDVNGSGASVFEDVKGRRGGVTLIASFNSTNGDNPNSGVVLDADGNLYGTTPRTFRSDGTVFEVVRGSGAVTTLATFNGANGIDPIGGVVLDAGGNLYGTTDSGGASGDGTVFEILKGSHAITTLASFDGPSGGAPSAGVVLDTAGDLYGTRYGGVFEVIKGSGTITPLASFSDEYPIGGLVLDPSGNLYGTAVSRVTASIVFEITKGSGAITALASFSGADAHYLLGGVVLDASGNVYGATYADPPYGGSTVFEITKDSGSITTLASFHDTNTGQLSGGPVLDASGNLYGTTHYGGPNGESTVFELSPIVAPPTVVGNLGLSDSTLATANQTQRSEVRNLTVTFSEPVTLGSDPFSLQLLNGGGAPTNSTAALGTPVQVAGSNGTQWSVAILANTPFSDSTGSLNDGSYQLVLHGAAVASNGTPMALDFTSPVFHRLLGDLAGDGKVDFDDLLVLAQNYGNVGVAAAQGDLNGDGRVGFDDLLALAQDYGKSTADLSSSAASSVNWFDVLLTKKRSRPVRI